LTLSTIFFQITTPFNYQAPGSKHQWLTQFLLWFIFLAFSSDWSVVTL